EEKFQEILVELEEKLYISNMDMLIPYIPREYVSNLFNYLKDDSLIFIDEHQRIEERTKYIREHFNLKLADKFEAGEDLSRHGKIKFEYMEVIKDTTGKISIVNTELLKQNLMFKPKSILNFSSKSVQSFHNNLDLLKEELNYYKYKGYKTI